MMAKSKKHGVTQQSSSHTNHYVDIQELPDLIARVIRNDRAFTDKQASRDASASRLLRA